jgi:hypothetical protein
VLVEIFGPVAAAEVVVVGAVEVVAVLDVVLAAAGLAAVDDVELELPHAPIASAATGAVSSAMCFLMVFSWVSGESRLAQAARASARL